MLTLHELRPHAPHMPMYTTHSHFMNTHASCSYFMNAPHIHSIQVTLHVYLHTPHALSPPPFSSPSFLYLPLSVSVSFLSLQAAFSADRGCWGGPIICLTVLEIEFWAPCRMPPGSGPGCLLKPTCLLDALEAARPSLPFPTCLKSWSLVFFLSFQNVSQSREILKKLTTTTTTEVQSNIYT